MLQLREANIISTSMEAMLYGFSVLMFMLTMWILLRNRRRRRLNYGMITAACSLQTLATMELIVNIVHLCQGFLSIGPSLPGGPEQFFNDVTQSTWILKSSLYNVQTLILDGVVIYRTYVVWQRVYIIIVPVLGWLALLASSIRLNVAFGNAAEHRDDVFAKQTGQWITIVYSLTLVTNVSATSLLAFRIWRVNREVSRYRSTSRLASVLRVILESGAIYSVTVTTALITFVINSPGVYVLLDMISPIISIVFNMIIIRVGFASDRRLPVVGSTTQQGPILERSNGEDQGRFRTSGYRSDSRFEMKSLAVEITQYIETDADTASVVDFDLKTNDVFKGDAVSSPSKSPADPPA